MKKNNIFTGKRFRDLFLVTFLLFLMPGLSSAGTGLPGMISLPDTADISREASKDNTPKSEKNYKNIFRYCITNTLLFGTKTLIFGYERTIGKHQSFSVNVGELELPKLSFPRLNINDTLVTASRSSTSKGYNISVDYRFYLAKENKYNSPHGVYIAPYASYNFFERKNTLVLNSSLFKGDLNTDFKLTMKTIGGELGYQFILWNRCAIDFILIGPGITRYSVSTSLSTTLTPDDQAELFKKINDALASKIPGYSLVIDEQEYERSGNVNTTTFGFRYMIHVGFRF